jgi:spore photoproduct lyase
MSTSQYYPETICIKEDCLNNSHTQEILQRLPDIEYEIVKKTNTLIQQFQKLDHPFETGKKMLYLTEHKGRLIHKCPGTKGFLCCHYIVLDLIENCPIDCSYCFLRSYLTNFSLSVHTDLSKVQELIHCYANQNKKLFRLGTGELSDSLALDHITHHSLFLMETVKDIPHLVLELKTKSNNVDLLLTTDPPDNIVISWSLNPQSIIDTEEIFAATLVQRLQAAKKVCENGYRVAFHFDPIILIENWEQAYGEVVKQLFQIVDNQKIMWISLGGLRFNKPNELPTSSIFSGEFIPCQDTKYRYFAELRYEMYRFMISRIKAQDASVPVYMCMEDRDAWEILFDQQIKNRISVEKLIQQRLLI